MGTKSRKTVYGASVRAAAERAAEARKEADRLAVESWNKRMLGFQGPAQPTLGDALNAGRSLECEATLWLDIDRPGRVHIKQSYAPLATTPPEKRLPTRERVLWPQLHRNTFRWHRALCLRGSGGML
jgi:hypothetical protein